LYRIPPVYDKDPKTGRPKDKPTTSAKVYKNLVDRWSILEKVRYWKLLSKMLSTYLIPATTSQWLSADGYVHTNFNQAGTVTSRLSSSDPVNLQNIPTPEKEPGTLLAYLPVKNIFTHTDWEFNAHHEGVNSTIYDKGALVVADYSGMELRVFASLAKCQTMIDIHRSGLDFHRMIAAMSKRLLTKDDVQHAVENQVEIQKVLDTISKEVRYVYKWTNWTILFGGSEYTLQHLYNIPLDEGKKSIKMYFDIFPEVPEFQAKIIESTQINGYVESPYGRREYLPYINDSDNGRRMRSEREAVNMPVQSGASDTLVAALILVDRELIRRDMRTRLCNEVHDSLMGDCSRNEIVQCSSLIKDMMMNITTYGKVEMPHLDFDWLICPLDVDVEIGTHYGSCIDYNDWLKEYGNEYDRIQENTYKQGLSG